MKKRKFEAVKKFIDDSFLKDMLSQILATMAIGLMAIIGGLILDLVKRIVNSEHLSVPGIAQYPGEAFVLLGRFRITDEHIFYFGIALVVVSVFFGIISKHLLRIKARKLEVVFKKEYGSEYIIPNNYDSPIEEKG